MALLSSYTNRNNNNKNKHKFNVKNEILSPAILKKRKDRRLTSIKKTKKKTIELLCRRKAIHWYWLRFDESN